MILAALTTSELVRYCIALLLIIGAAVYRFFRVNVPEIFNQVILENSLTRKGATHFALVRNGVEGEVVLTNPETKYRKLIILATSQSKLSFELKIMPATLQNKFNSAVNVTLLKTGDPDFDQEFLVRTNDENMALRLLDEQLRSELLNNKHFIRDTLTVDDSCLHSDFAPIIKNKPDLENYKDVMEFFMDIVGKITHLEKGNRQ